MRFRLEATEEELRTKGERLVETLAKSFACSHPELSEILEKALPRKEPDLKYPMLRELKAEARAEYEATLKRMLAGIGKVLDQGASFQKSHRDLLPIVGQTPKAVVAYIYDKDTDYECRDCNMFIPDKRQCMIHEPEVTIQPYGSCSYFIKGPPMPGAEAHGGVTPAESNYGETPHRDGYSCKRCVNFLEPRNCGVVDVSSDGATPGEIHPDACCNAWEALAAELAKAGGPYIGPRGGKWADPQHTIAWKEPAPTRPAVMGRSILRVLDNDPILTDAQRKQARSDALNKILENPVGDPSQWQLPAGARVVDPWAPKAIDASAKWEHPDYGSGTGPAPWQLDEDWSPDLHKYDTIILNNSAGKDSQAMLTHVVELAKAQKYPLSQIVVVHADLGRAEWEGTKELAQKQAEHYGLRFEVVSRTQNDLIEQIEERHGDLTQRLTDVASLAANGITTWAQLAELGPEGTAKLIDSGKGTSKWEGDHRAKEMVKKAQKKAEAGDGSKNIDYGKAIAWPSMDARYCTSDHKRAEVKKLITKLTKEHRDKHGKDAPKPRILNALGIRAQESPGREAMDNFQREEETGTRTVDRWYPIHRWHEQKVWSTISKSGVPYHKAYALGMRRLSCVFCVFATKEDIMVAATHNPKLFGTYLDLEERVGASFQPKMSLAQVADEIQKRRDAGFSLSELGEWVKKALGLEDLDDALVKAELERRNPDFAGLIMQAALVRLRKGGKRPVATVIEWKANGACVHLDTRTDSHHCLYLPYPDAYNASLAIAAFARSHDLSLEEHNQPGELPEVGEELSKAGGPYYGPRGGKWADPDHTIPWDSAQGAPRAKAQEEEAKAKKKKSAEGGKPQLSPQQAKVPTSAGSGGIPSPRPPGQPALGSAPQKPQAAPQQAQMFQPGSAPQPAQQTQPGAAQGQPDAVTPPTGEDPQAYDVDPGADPDGDGIADAARVGIPGKAVLPPPGVPRLPNLNPRERAVEGKFAETFQKDPDGMAKAFYDVAAKNNFIFETDAAKSLMPEWTRPDLPADEKGKPIHPERAQARALYNTAMHQTANAVVKRAFLQRLDEIAKMPEGERKILVTSGGVAGGKGSALAAAPELAKSVAATWDAAGEQNSTENPWLMEECEKRGIKAVFLFVAADPTVTWPGAVERAKSIGRMVDARAFADSYAHGAKNFAAFHERNRDKASFVFAKAKKGEPVAFLDKMPPDALEMDADTLYKRSMDYIESKKDELPTHIYEGATAGARIWGGGRPQQRRGAEAAA